MKKTFLELSEQIDAYFKPPDLHIAATEQATGKSALLIAALALAAEIFLIWQLITGIWSLPQAIIAHMTTTFAVILYALLRLRTRTDARFETILALAIFTSGVFGAAGVILSIVIRIYGVKSHKNFDDFFESISPRIIKSRSERIYEDILSGRDDAVISHTIIPFLDVISFGSDVQKRHALGKMTRHFSPDFAPLFRKALNDSSNMIRVQAATAIARIESQFLKRMNKLSALPVAKLKNPEIMLAVAEHYDNYAYTGLIDRDNEMLNRKKALDLYNEYLNIYPQDHSVYAKIGRIMMRNGNYEKSCYWFERYFAENNNQINVETALDKNSASGNKNHLDAISDWYSESLFSLGRYDDLREFAAKAQPAGKRDDLHLISLKQALNLWEKPNLLEKSVHEIFRA